MNPISKELKKGTIGELLLQIRLLEYGIQASSPLKDSGNDLIAIKGDVFRAIQVKTTINQVFKFEKNKLPEKYHILALVKLKGEDSDIFLDKSEIFLLKKENVSKGYYSCNQLEDFKLNKRMIDELFNVSPETVSDTSTHLPIYRR